MLIRVSSERNDGIHSAVPKAERPTLMRMKLRYSQLSSWTDFGSAKEKNNLCLISRKKPGRPGRIPPVPRAGGRRE